MNTLPLDLINKILIMRPVHPCAKILKHYRYSDLEGDCQCGWFSEMDQSHIHYSITEIGCSTISSKYEIRNGDDDIYYRKIGEIDWIGVGI
jgi:hypothetical protein